MSSDLQCLEPNPDISGIGVRIAFYVQTSVCVILVGRSLPEALAGLWTLLGTSFGLTVSAIVSAAQHQLPLHQAIIVTYLVWISNIAVFLAHASYARSPNPPKLLKYVVVTQTYFSLACTLYVWARAPSFGSGLSTQGNINDRTVFVIFFVSTSAVGKGRIAALAIVVTLLLAYTIFLIYLSVRMRRLEKAKRQKKPGPQDSLPPNPIDPHLGALVTIFAPILTVTVICTELQISKNKLCASNSAWGFGQILALIVTVVPTVTMIDGIKKHGFAQKKVPDKPCFCPCHDGAHAAHPYASSTA